MLKTNEAKLPCLRVAAVTAPYREPASMGLWVGADGTGAYMPGSGGICTNVRVGDRIDSVLGCHIAPGVCLAGANKDDGALALYANPGTPVRRTGRSAPEGYVVGRCSLAGGGVLAAAFSKKTIDELNGDERFLLDCRSCGLTLSDWPMIRCFLDPGVLSRIPAREEGGRLLFPAAKILPERCAGSLGGDLLSVMTEDKADFAEFGLDTLRYGDFVLFTDIDACYGTAFYEGAATLGVVTDGGAPHAGGGPGVTPVLSCQTGLLGAYVSEAAGNIGTYCEGGD